MVKNLLELFIRITNNVSRNGKKIVKLYVNTLIDEFREIID